MAGAIQQSRRRADGAVGLVDGPDVPLGDHLHSPSPAEGRLAETTLAAIRSTAAHRAGRPSQKPVRVICRQSLRQRSAAKAVAAARKRTDPPAQEESRSSPNLPGVLSHRLLHDRLTEGCANGREGFRRFGEPRASGRKEVCCRLPGERRSRRQRESDGQRLGRKQRR
jgi:hypothetical protein